MYCASVQEKRSRRPSFDPPNLGQQLSRLTATEQTLHSLAPVQSTCNKPLLLFNLSLYARNFPSNQMHADLSESEDGGRKRIDRKKYNRSDKSQKCDKSRRFLCWFRKCTKIFATARERSCLKWTAVVYLSINNGKLSLLDECKERTSNPRLTVTSTNLSTPISSPARNGTDALFARAGSNRHFTYICTYVYGENSKEKNQDAWSK